MSKLSIWSHATHDWCHLCGKRSEYTADVFYPKNAEHGPSGTKYVRICRVCAEEVANAAQGHICQPSSSEPQEAEG